MAGKFAKLLRAESESHPMAEYKPVSSRQSMEIDSQHARYSGADESGECDAHGTYYSPDSCRRPRRSIANGCRYDSFAAAWLPPACRNDELIDQFERAGPNPDGSWPYYGDKNKTQVLSLEEVSMLPETGGHFFSTHQWHLVHCAYYWKKMFLALKDGTIIEHRYNNLAHLGHCEMMFLKRDPLDTIVTEAGVSLHSDVIVTVQKHGHGSHSRSV
ncbi:hypothetical protein BDV25DRAFT_138077 [Aspergillus avenaceus]|uniref:Uncharacterized protein n=1 Tax=Aspergillus avenaceus TaxID=36643 RepID=A0A5N6U107_ASPAV|nr:hypothetical protein BDV25DRAFT_138077 [Aspergillus avenaceus]